MCDRDYYNRENYEKTFEKIWERLRELHIANKTIAEINNSALFKFSPYKKLNFEQLDVVSEVLQNIDQAITEGRKSLSVIGGDAGTGKTIVIMYLAKLLVDLQNFDNLNDDIDDESNFGIFFEREQINHNFKDKRIAVVVPQPSLCSRVGQIFEKIDTGDVDIRVLSPINFGKCDDGFDITLVDEAHLLNSGITGTQAKATQDIDFKLFGSYDTKNFTQLDWIMKKSENVVMVYSDQQRIRQPNIRPTDVKKYSGEFDLRHYELKTQMRSVGGKKYIDYIHDIFSNGLRPQHIEYFDKFDAKLFVDFRNFVKSIHEKNDEFGLSRMVAGYSWAWNSKKDSNAYDIEIDGVKLRWNSTTTNWIGSGKSIDEVGSIYTVQGDDLNYVGVIIGRELIYRNGSFYFNKDAYTDTGAKKRSQLQAANKVEISDEDFLNQILRTYRILLNRAVKGVYIYACDDGVREYLKKYFEIAG